MIDYKLHIPGPVDVSADAYKAMSTRVMGHRSPDFVDLYQSCQPRLKQLFQTNDPVFLSTSSAWGVMEGAIRNLCAKKLFAVCAVPFPTNGWMWRKDALKMQMVFKLNGDHTSILYCLMKNFPPGNMI